MDERIKKWSALRPMQMPELVHFGKASGVTVERFGGGWVLQCKDGVLSDDKGYAIVFKDLEPIIKAVARHGISECTVEFSELHPDDMQPLDFEVVPTVGYIGKA